MARMPAGTMRFAQSSGQEFTTDITNPAKKSKVYDTIIPKDSSTEQAYRKSIALALKISDTDALKMVTSDALKELVINGQSTIDGKKVTMSDQSIMLCAYGDCTNPGVALKMGLISTPDIPSAPTVNISANAETAIMEEVTRMTTHTSTRTENVNILV